MLLHALLLPLLTTATAPALESLAVAGLAQEYVVEGVIEHAFVLRTAGSEQVLLLSRTGSFQDGSDADQRSARLYATLYRLQGDERTREWVVQDRVDACMLDLTAEFTDPPATVSDADADGVPEIWVSYRTACRGDVSPATLKLIGYEGNQKYALRGTARLSMGDSGEGGDYTADAAFTKAPAALLTFAQQHWTQIRDEHF